MAGQNQPTPPSSTSSNNGASPDGQTFRVVRKRNRIPLSCGPCRHRKLKCNRGHPCDNCTKRGDTTSCSYATPGNRKRGSMNAANATPDDMQNRIDRLEGLVLSLMTAGPQAGSAAAAQAAITFSPSESTSTVSEQQRLDSTTVEMITEETPGDESEVDTLSKGIGIMKMDGNKTIFASDAHWYAILGEISEVKKYFEGHKEDYRQHMAKVQAAKADENHGVGYLLQGQPAKDKNELLAAFPPKADADRLIARYFNAYDPSVHIIHGPTFQKAYDQYWIKPNDAPVIWLGLNFAMMTLALQSYYRAGDEPPEYRGRSLELSHEYRRLTAQALLLADITQPTSYTLETMVLHVQAEYGRSRDAEPSVLMLTSLCVRLAMRMGYHRDPGPHPGITPFQGELRRRVWTFIRTIDSLISFQFGLPAMVKTDHMDTVMPRNLYDDELYEDMERLPPSRPTFEATPMSYMITKSRLTLVFGRIVERSDSVTNPPSYEETMRFDQELREVRSQHPPLLQMRSFQESARDPANLIMQRLGLEMMFLRSLFVLHRRFIARGRESQRYAYSRRTCLDASMDLLNHQATLHAESQPGGRLRSVKWYISSLTTHDFLLAAMLVCLDLYHTAEFECKGRKPSSPSSSLMADVYDDGKREQMLGAVERCIIIWESLRDRSMEAYKGSIALRVMVEKLKTHQERQRMGDPAAVFSSSSPHGGASIIEAMRSTAGAQFRPQTSPNFGIFPNGHVNVGNVKLEDLPPEQSAAMTLGMLSSGGMSPGAGFGVNLHPNGGAANGIHGNANEQRPTYPASMAALLNDPVPERTGLTPQYSGPEATAMHGLPSGAMSPLTQLMGGQSGPGFMGMDAMGGDIDWSAWDSYIQGTGSGMDATQIWPMNLDLTLDGPQQPPAPNGNNNNSSNINNNNSSSGNSNNGAVFMGAVVGNAMQ